MTLWNPDWAVEVNGLGDVTNLVLSDLTITSGRSDIYSQPVAGYCRFTLKNLTQSAIAFDVNDSIVVKIKDSTGTYIPLFGGDISDIDIVVATGEPAITQNITITALGALSKLPKVLTQGVLSKDFDGDQIYEILSAVLFDQWNEVPAAETWAAYDPTVTWANAENSGLGEIDRPGDYELTDRSASTTDVYSLVASLATSGLGYIYEDASGRIGYADSTHRSQYLAANGYAYVDGGWAYANGISTSKRLGDIRNKVTITYKNGQQQTAEEAASIAVYGTQAQNIQTSIERTADALSQAEFYLDIRAYPQYQFKSITFPMANPNIPDASRDQAFNIFMGLPLDIEDLPVNIANGRYQGFVEGWTWTTRFNALDLTVIVSPVAFSLQAFRWNNVPITETWNTISPTLDWNNATIVA
ncbi:hypothetical protein UFOVP443_8 [uncultured Caudovirales phage]|uniref:Uncharacterized protein n=1 Tax=uncultured Caudovirales phage TaxID=2100421 RepID=A0A6J5MA15_9CAUD|nr:hypothetical protein UFOVP443_8 [uncultured Caudovirales phage]